MDDPVMADITATIELGRSVDRAAARRRFTEIWNDDVGPSGDAFHRCVLAHYAADVQDDPSEELRWDQRALDAAGEVTDERAQTYHASLTVAGFYPSLHLNLADVHRRLGDVDRAGHHLEQARAHTSALADDGYGRMIRDGIERCAARITDAAGRADDRTVRAGSMIDTRPRKGAPVLNGSSELIDSEEALIPLGMVQSRAKMSAALRYPGSKWSIANEVVSNFKSHYHYIEPYFGSGAIFFTKDPSPHELINDTNHLAVNFFKVLRDRTEDLCWALETTPWSREEYSVSHIETDDALEDARRFIVRIWQAHASDLAKKTGWKNRGVKQRARGMSVRWQRVPTEITALAWRLADAEIESRPALEVIERFAAPDCLIYADPPYLPSTRTQKMYAHEMSEEEHVLMLDALDRHPGPVVLSGYANTMYEKRLRTGWTAIAVKPPKVEKGAMRTEMLWVKD